MQAALPQPFRFTSNSLGQIDAIIGGRNSYDASPEPPAARLDHASLQENASSFRPNLQKACCINARGLRLLDNY